MVYSKIYLCELLSGKPLLVDGTDSHIPSHISGLSSVYHIQGH